MPVWVGIQLPVWYGFYGWMFFLLLTTLQSVLGSLPVSGTGAFLHGARTHEPTGQEPPSRKKDTKHMPGCEHKHYSTLLDVSPQLQQTYTHLGPLVSLL